jgi:hypothetical protein
MDEGVRQIGRPGESALNPAEGNASCESVFDKRSARLEGGLVYSADILLSTERK